METKKTVVISVVITLLVLSLLAYFGYKYALKNYPIISKIQSLSNQWPSQNDK